MAKTLTKAIEKHITADWQSRFAGLAIHKPRQLLRRIGPLLEGIHLGRGTDGQAYLPEFHIHFLGTHLPTLTLILSTSLRTQRTNAEEWIPVRWHDEKFPDAATRMANFCLLPMSGDVTLDAVLDAYRGYITTPLGRAQMGILYLDMVRLAAWARKLDLANALIEQALPQLDMNPIAFRHVGGRSQLIEDLNTAIRNPRAIDRTVESEVQALKVAKLPMSTLIT